MDDLTLLAILDWYSSRFSALIFLSFSALFTCALTLAFLSSALALFEKEATSLAAASSSSSSAGLVRAS